MSNSAEIVLFSEISEPTVPANDIGLPKAAAEQDHKNLPEPVL